MTLSETITKYKSVIMKLSIVLGVLLLGAMLYIASSLSNINTPPLISLPQKSAPSPTPTPIRSEMRLEPSSIETNTEKRFDVEIVIDAYSTVINGIDSVVTYDPTMLRVVRINPSTQPDPSFSLMRRQTEKNRVIVTSIKTKYDVAPTNQVILARVTFQPLKAGTTSLSFEHKAGTTTGSTIIKADNSENILDKVTGTNITIK